MTTIYFAGKMYGLTTEESLKWQNQIEDAIQYRLEIRSHIRGLTSKNIKFIHPPLLYNYDSNFHKTEREVKDYELMMISKSDIIIVNLEGVNDSVGTHYELAMAEFLKKIGRAIFIIGYGEADGVHPWILDTINRIEENPLDISRYICDYLL